MMSRSIGANYEGVPAYGTEDKQLVLAQQRKVQETSVLQILNNLKKSPRAKPGRGAQQGQKDCQEGSNPHDKHFHFHPIMLMLIY